MEGLTNKRRKDLRPQTAVEEDRVSMRGERTETLWKHRGQVLSDFLQQMKEHNAGVVCSSSEEHNAIRPAAKATRAFARKP